MSDLTPARVRELLAQTVGPAPWYWKTFPAFDSINGPRFGWTHHGEQGAIGFLVSFSLEQERDQARLALNTYCRPFLVPPSYLGIWCPEGQLLRFTCFDPATLKAFDLAEVAGWFKQSSERIYAATAPIADFAIPLALAAGRHKIDVPAVLASVEELIAPTSYRAMSECDPAFALFVVNLHDGLVEVLPQRWFTRAQYDVGRQWITRAARHRESDRIIGECFGAGTFLLQEDGCRLEKWIEKSR